MSIPALAHIAVTALLLICTTAPAADLLPIVPRTEAEALPDNLRQWIAFVRNNARSFPALTPNTRLDATALQKFELSSTLAIPEPAIIHDGRYIGGFRFRAPAGADLYWSFAFPPELAGKINWMIVSLKPLEVEPRFTDFHQGKVPASALPDAPDTPYTRIDQTLPRAAFRPREEYVIVFSTTEPKEKLPFFVTLNFYPARDLAGLLMDKAYKPAE